MACQIGIRMPCRHESIESFSTRVGREDRHKKPTFSPTGSLEAKVHVVALMRGGCIRIEMWMVPLFCQDPEEHQSKIANGEART